VKLEIELKSGIQQGPPFDALVYQRLVSALGRAQPEFLDDWQISIASRIASRLSAYSAFATIPACFLEVSRDSS
jgi:hypothetical protein